MMWSDPTAAAAALIRRTSIGSRVLVDASEAAAALALAEAGRRVWTFGTSETALAQIAASHSEVRARIVTSNAHREATATSAALFEGGFLGGTLLVARSPLETIRDMQRRCVPRAPIVLDIPNGIRSMRDAPQWSIDRETATRLFAPAGSISVDATPDQCSLIVTVGRALNAPPRESRIGVIWRLVGEDRYTKRSLASFAEIATFVIALDDQTTATSFALVRREPLVINHLRRATARTTELEIDAARQAAYGWEPDWILSLSSSEVLAPGTRTAIEGALREAPAACDGFRLPMEMMVDVEGSRRSDTPSSYATQIRLTRAGRQTSSILDLDAPIRDFEFFDSAVRTARRLGTAIRSTFALSAPDDWRMHDGSVEPARADARPVGAMDALLSAACTARSVAPTRVLAIDSRDIDAARVFAAAWPMAGLTAVTRDRLTDPARMPFAISIVSAFETIDLPLYFSGQPFDAIVDGCADQFADDLVSRLRRASSILAPGGTIVALYDETQAQIPFRTLLERRTFSTADLAIESIVSDGLRFAIVASPYAPYVEPSRSMTIVIPQRAGSATCAAETQRRLSSALAGTDVAVLVAAQYDPDAVPHDPQRTVIAESGIDTMIMAAWNREPARAICVIEPGTQIDADWHDALLAVLDGGAGIAVLDGPQSRQIGEVVDGPVFAVSIDAVPPKGWPRGFSDDLLRSGVLCGIAARAGKAAVLVRSHHATGPERRAVGAPEYEREAARARARGLPLGLVPHDSR